MKPKFVFIALSPIILICLSWILFTKLHYNPNTTQETTASAVEPDSASDVTGKTVAVQRQLEISLRVSSPAVTATLGNPVTTAADNPLLSTFKPAVFLRVLPVWCWWTLGLLLIAFVVLRLRTAKKQPITVGAALRGRPSSNNRPSSSN